MKYLNALLTGAEEQRVKAKKSARFWRDTPHRHQSPRVALHSVQKEGGRRDNDIYELFGRNKSANERARVLNLLQSFGLVKADLEGTGISCSSKYLPNKKPLLVRSQHIVDIARVKADR